MFGWLVVNGFLHNNKFDEIPVLFQKAAEKFSVSLRTVQNSEVVINTEGVWFEKKPDFVIFWDKDILLARCLEHMGVRVYNSSDCIDICDDKRKTHLALLREGIPMPETMIAPMTYETVGFTHYDFLDSVEERLSYPFVMKEAFGSFGKQVYLIENREKLIKKIEAVSTYGFLFQEFIEESRGRDIRLQVVGNEVIGGMYRYSETDFRANVTAGGKIRDYEPSEKECQLAVRAAEAVGADFAGVDLLFGKEGSLVCEVNSNAHFKNLLDCSGVNTAEHIIKYVCGKGEG